MRTSPRTCMTGDLTGLLLDIVRSCKQISGLVSYGDLAGIYGKEGASNVQVCHSCESALVRCWNAWVAAQSGASTRKGNQIRPPFPFSGHKDCVAYNIVV